MRGAVLFVLVGFSFLACNTFSDLESSVPFVLMAGERPTDTECGADDIICQSDTLRTLCEGVEVECAEACHGFSEGGRYELDDEFREDSYCFELGLEGDTCVQLRSECGRPVLPNNRPDPNNTPVQNNLEPFDCGSVQEVVDAAIRDGYSAESGFEELCEYAGSYFGEDLTWEDCFSIFQACEGEVEWEGTNAANPPGGDPTDPDCEEVMQSVEDGESCSQLYPEEVCSLCFGEDNG